jgi:YceI-like domain
MKNLVVAIVVLMSAGVALSSQAQDRVFTRNGSISFLSETSAENIDAINNEVFSIVDVQKGELAFIVLVTGFKFKKALMQEHFNDDYLESSKFPKASFKGAITDLSKVHFNEDGSYKAMVSGILTIHGVAKKIAIPAVFKISNKKISGESNFGVKLADYNIQVPGVVAGQIAETIDLKVSCQYEPYVKKQ